MYKREKYERLLLELNKKEITVITGMRRVGKTTILESLYDTVESDNKAFIDLENVINRSIFEEINYDNVLVRLSKVFGLKFSHKAYVFIDEIQYVPNITSVIKYLYDHNDIKFVVTGSSSFYLKKHFTESMAGRKLIFDIYPLTFNEFLTFKNVERDVPESYSDKSSEKDYYNSETYNEYYEEYVEFGGFPGVVLADGAERKKELLLEIFNTYFSKDVSSLADFKDVGKLRDLILLLISRVGSRVNISKISTALEINRERVYSYLEFLESTYFIQSISVFSNTDKRILKAKKYYICDTGLSRSLAEISEGQLFENSVFQNLRPNHEFNYYQNSRGNEVDFILDRKIALEVKLTASKLDLVNLKRRAQAVELDESYIVSKIFVDLDRVVMAWDI